MIATVSGFALLGAKWREATVVMHLQLGSSGGELIDGAASWGESAESALAIWNRQIRDVQFRVVRDSASPIREGDGVNNVFFAPDAFGSGFGGAVAITTTWRTGNRRTEADVIFSTREDWNSYRGGLRRASDGGTLYDLRRVALHEFGHVLGLDHPDDFGQRVTAIMNSSVSDIDALKADDIAGGQFLYGTGIAGLVKVSRPAASPFVTSRNQITMRGTADGDQVLEVVLKIGSKSFPAQGVAQWRRSIPLAPGVNRVGIHAITNSGALRKIETVRIRRE